MTFVVLIKAIYEKNMFEVRLHDSTKHYNVSAIFFLF